MKKNFKNVSVISTGSWVPTNLYNKSKIKNTYKILINELTLDAFIGIHDFEKKKKQRVKFNIEILTDPYVSPNSKNLNSIFFLSQPNCDHYNLQHSIQKK